MSVIFIFLKIDKHSGHSVFNWYSSRMCIKTLQLDIEQFIFFSSILASSLICSVNIVLFVITAMFIHQSWRGSLNRGRPDPDLGRFIWPLLPTSKHDRRVMTKIRTSFPEWPSSSSKVHNPTSFQWFKLNKRCSCASSWQDVAR